MQTLDAVRRVRLPRLHAGQALIKEQRLRFNVLQCGRRFGKTTFGSVLIAEAALAGFPAAWFAPTYKLLSEVWAWFCERLESVIAIKDSQIKQLRLITGGIIDFWSLDTPNAGRGRKYKRIAIDEAGIVRDLEDHWNASIRPTLTDLKGDAWFLGTPKGRNFFHTLWARGQAHANRWASWRVGTIHNPTIDPAEIEDAKRDLPQAVFDQEYGGIPADDGGNPFGIEAVNRCMGPLSTRDPVAFGVDLAKSVDWTWVIGIDNEGCICVSERWQSDWDNTTDRLAFVLRKAPSLMDSTGVGDPIVERIQRRVSNCEGLKFTSQSKQMLMEGLAVAIQRGEIKGIPENLAEELKAFLYEYTKTGVRYEAPPGMHDDGVCALALAVQRFRTRPTGIQSTSGIMIGVANGGFR